MAFTQADLTNIDTAIATGELSVEVNGRKVVYRSVEELLKARKTITTILAESNTSTAGVRRGAFKVNFTTHRGD